MSISKNPSDYEAQPSIIQKVRERQTEMREVARALRNGEVIYHDPAEGYAIVEGQMKIGFMEPRVKLHINTDSEPNPEINRMEIED